MKTKEKVAKWSIVEVENWLIDNGFSSYVELFCKHHCIDGKALLSITEDDLKTPPISMQVLGDIKRLMMSINELKSDGDKGMLVNKCPNFHYYPADFGSTVRFRKRRIHNNDSSDHGSDDGGGDNLVDNANKFKPDIWKSCIAVIYFLIVTWITAFVMVFVHNRVPDMQVFRPLPDIFLDHVPLIPGAFDVSEYCGITLFLIWCVILLTHKHRFILLRRMCSLFGSVFLLRCVTMMITSLSVPGQHLKCEAKTYNFWWEKVSAAFMIWLSDGMSIYGVRTCGDYMFSGHTAAITLLNFFITEYTPPKIYYLHIVTWMLNCFGIFFILAGHENYSIDVFVAFYISTRLFLYYHTLANNRTLMQRDRRRTRIWFPLFSFFEAGVDGIVPNEYESPISLLPQNFQDKLKIILQRFYIE